MLQWIPEYYRFLGRCFVNSFKGDTRFYTWMTALSVLVLIGLNAYCRQLVDGLATTGMTDHVSWGMYIANFTYLVGIAAAAVMLVIPVYIYKNKELHDVVLFGELLAISVIVMCMLFVTADLGRPERMWHLFPIVGRVNFPVSMLSWDVIVLTIYLILNAHVCGYLLYMRYLGRPASPALYMPFVFLSIVWAISIHTVTAFLYVGLGARPYWNSAIIAPRFIASAFVAGPAFIILALQLIRKYGGFPVKDKALLTLRSIMQVTMLINFFLLGCEVFTEFYTDSLHVASAKYLYFGLHGYDALVPWIWTAIGLNTVATVLLLLPASKGLRVLDLACVLCIVGIWIEKGMGLIIPGFIPTPLGQIVEYVPSTNEILVCVGIWAFGLLFYTVLVKTALPILRGELSAGPSGN